MFFSQPITQGGRPTLETKKQTCSNTSKDTVAQNKYKTKDVFACLVPIYDVQAGNGSAALASEWDILFSKSSCKTIQAVITLFYILRRIN